MALAAATVFEVRTTGTSTNGGGFVPGATGTDWSQQDPVKYALIGVTSAGAGNTVLTASAVDDMVGNIAQCISGTNFRAGFYQIISVVPGVSITFSTNAANNSICTGIGAIGVINIGGAVDLISTLNSALSPGNTVFVQAGTYTKTAFEGITIASTSGNPQLNVVGYSTTRSVGANTDPKPLFTSSTDSADLIKLTSCSRTKFYNLRLTSTASVRGNGWTFGAGNTYLAWENCECDGVNVGWDTTSGSTRGLWISSVAANCVSNGWSIGDTQSDMLIACWGYNNGGSGAALTTAAAASSVSFVSCAFTKNVADGIVVGTGSTILPAVFVDGCTLAGNTGNGFSLSLSNGGNTGNARIMNTIMYGNGQYGNKSSVSSCWNNPNSVLRNNAYGANGVNPTLNVTDTLGTVTLTADPFKNSASNDYTLNSTPGGGGALLGTGFPSQIGSNTFHIGPSGPDIGATSSVDGPSMPLGG